MVRVHIDLKVPRQKLSPKSVDLGRYALANQALGDMNQFIPMDEGILRLKGTIDSEGKGINYNTPYAAKLFYMYMYNYTTPGTGPRWDIRAKRLFVKDWVDAFVKGAGW